MDGWALAETFGRFIYLAGMAAPLGGILVLYLEAADEPRQRHHMLIYILWGALLVLVGSLCFFLARVGAVNQRGLAGIWDLEMIQYLAGSGLGYTTVLRVLGSLFVGVMVLLDWRRSMRDLGGASFAAWDAWLVVVGLFGFAFSVSGHAAALSGGARALITLHALAVFLWIGSLYPLLYFTRRLPVERLRRVFRHFGRYMAWVIAALLLSGIALLALLLDSWTVLFTTAYGIAMLIKLFGVAGLLALAGLNRWRLMPGLEEDGKRAVRLSISLEMALALLILAVTAWLSTGPGPG